MPAGPGEVGAAPWGRSHDPPVTLPPAGWVGSPWLPGRAGWGQKCHEGNESPILDGSGEARSRGGGLAVSGGSLLYN